MTRIESPTGCSPLTTTADRQLSFFPEFGEQCNTGVKPLVAGGIKALESLIYQSRLPDYQLSQAQEAILAAAEKRLASHLIDETARLVWRIEDHLAQTTGRNEATLSLPFGHFISYLEKEYFGVHFIRSPQQFVEAGHPTSAEKFLTNYLLAANTLAFSILNDDPHREKLSLALGALLRSLRKKNFSRFGATLGLVDQIANDLGIDSRLSALIADSYYDPSFQRAKAKIASSKAVKRSYQALPPERRAVLRAVKISTQEEVALTYQSLLEDWAGLNAEQVRYSLPRLACKYGLSIPSISVRICFIQNFIEARLPTSRPRNFQRKGPDLTASCPQDFFVFLRLATLIGPTERLELAINRNEWRETSRSLGIAQFHLFLLKTAAEIICQEKSPLRMKNIWGKLTEEAKSWIADYCQVDSQSISISPQVIRKAVDKMSDTTTSPWVKKSRAALKIEERILAHDLFIASASGDFSPISVGAVPTRLLCQGLANEIPFGRGYRQRAARSLNLPAQTISSLCKILTIEAIISGVFSKEEWGKNLNFQRWGVDLLANPAIDPRNLVASPDLSGNKLSQILGRAFLFVNQTQYRQKLRDYLVETVIESILEEQQLLLLEKFLLTRTIQGFSGRAVVGEIEGSLRKVDLGLSKRDREALFLLVSQALMILLRFPFSWGEAQKLSHE